MRNLPIEILGDVEDYSDEFGNMISGKIFNKGKIVFKGYNAKICSGGGAH